MPRLASALAVALTLAACASHPAASGGPELRPLTIEQVATRIAAHDGKTYVFDDNSQESWRAGHVPGAVWLDDEAVTPAALPADKAATLIFYCHNEG